MQLFTIGYEGKSLDQFVAELRRNRISRVIDVRELPLSRRKGFSKTPLTAALAAAGIGYVHVREAGNPFRHLRHDVDACLAAYARHIEESPEVIDRVLGAAERRRAALLCVEATADRCHRSLIARQLRQAAKRSVVDL
jgi:uncharacterized protein (DUF488 family)